MYSAAELMPPSLSRRMLQACVARECPLLDLICHRRAREACAWSRSHDGHQFVSSISVRWKRGKSTRAIVKSDTTVNSSKCLEVFYGKERHSLLLYYCIWAKVIFAEII